MHGSACNAEDSLTVHYGRWGGPADNSDIGVYVCITQRSDMRTVATNQGDVVRAHMDSPCSLVRGRHVCMRMLRLQCITSACMWARRT